MKVLVEAQVSILFSVGATKRVCGFIGLGSQGAPIARRIINAGYPMVLWARRPEALLPFCDTHATTAASIEELGHQADHIGICVVGDDGVLEIGERLISCIRPGTTVAIHSTVLPRTCVMLERLARARQALLVDAAVSGGKPAADAGRLTLMIGGEDRAVATMKPIFDTFSHHQFHLGFVGSGQKAKLINNALMIANMGLAHCAVSAGERIGLNREQLITLVHSSSGTSFALETYSKYARPADFSNASALFEKVKLLAQLLGEESDAYQLLMKSAAQMMIQEPTYFDE